MRSQIRVALIAVAAQLAASPALSVECGDLITDAETLTADLSCSISPGLTIGEGGSLDMNGFTLACAGSSGGVSLVGPGAKLSNGVVTGCTSYGVSATAGKHKIQRVLVSSSGIGFAIISIDNKISDCAALDNTNQGFYVPAPDNSLSRLMAKGNGGTGVEASNGGHKISDVSISSPGTAMGMSLTGNANKVSKVRITGASTALSLSGSANKISEVTSLNHTTHGFLIFGGGNRIKKSVVAADTAAEAGFAIGGGSDNSISGCRSTGSTYGIRVVGGGNVVSKNKVFGSGDKGIELNGGSNVATGNLAVGSATFDLFESVTGCVNGDVWEKNVGTRNDACIE